MVLLNRSYCGYPIATIVQLGTVEEASLISQGLASNSAGPVTPGNLATTKTFGRAGIAAAGTSVTISNPSFTPESKFSVWLSNAVADTTALYVSRVVPVAGSVTFHLNAAATAAVALDWAQLGPAGGLLNGNG